MVFAPLGLPFIIYFKETPTFDQHTEPVEFNARRGFIRSNESSMKEPSPENVEAFTKAYGELVQKYGVDYAQFPQYVPDGQGGFKTVVQNIPVDVKDSSVKSPFIQ